MSFLDFFKRKPPEIEILDLLDKHLDLCIKATDLLSEALIRKLDEKQAEASKFIREIKKAEEDADYRRREIIDKLAYGILPPISKEDMMELVKLLDNVIDWTDESAQLLNIIDIYRTPEHIRNLIREQQKLGNQCVYTLRDTIKTLNHDYDEALDKCNLVEIIEHEMDNTYLQIHEAIYKTQLSVNEAILIKQLADCLENVGDSCEDTADLVRVVVVSAFR
jgi:predicted phosphate transport protein (TIGR00153 family)